MDKPVNRAAMIAAIVATGMVFIDTTALNVALDQIRIDLSATNTQLLWTLNGYALSLAALLLAAGSLGDRYGNRRVFGIGVVLFAVFSAACGSALNINWLIGFRVFQGIGAALMIPGSLTLVCDAFPIERRGKAIGIWTGCSVLMMTVGPIIGGALADSGRWQAIFWLNVPLSLVVLVLLRTNDSEKRAARNATNDLPLDFVGMALAAVGLVMVSFGCIRASEVGWQPMLALLVGGGLAVMLLFLWHESNSPNPMLPFSLIRKTEIWSACLVILLVYAAFHAMLVFIPLRLIQIDGMKALQAGVAQLPTLVCLIVSAPLAGILFDRKGATLTLSVGLLIAATGFGLLAMLTSAESYWIRWFPGLAAVGIGLGFAITSLGTTLMNSVPADRMGIASSLNSAVSRLASVLGVACLCGFGFSSLQSKLLEKSSDQFSTESSLSLSPDQIQSPEYQQAFLETFQTLSIVSAVILLSCLTLVALLQKTGRDAVN